MWKITPLIGTTVILIGIALAGITCSTSHLEQSNPKIAVGPSLGYYTALIYPDTALHQCTSDDEMCHSFIYAVHPVAHPPKFDSVKIIMLMDSVGTGSVDHADVVMRVLDPTGKSEVISKRTDVKPGQQNEIDFFYRPEESGKYVMTFEITSMVKGSKVIYDSYSLESEFILEYEF